MGQRFEACAGHDRTAKYQHRRSTVCKHASGKLILILSVHVDDVKLSGEQSEIHKAVSILEKHFDSLKLEWNGFEQ